jgi:hypothetical protein
LIPALLAGGCIEERLQVDVTTRILADGACERRIEYRLEHVDDRTGERVAIDPKEDGLRRFHRFPRSEPWRVRDEPGRDLHVVVAEALLPSPNQIGSDYARHLGPTAPPATNLVSFDCGDLGAGEVCDYAELFVDRSSPPQVLAQITRWVSERDLPFAKAVATALGPAAPSTKALRAAYRERFALPLAARANALADRRFFGPRESREVDQLLDEGTGLASDLATAVASLAPGAGDERVEEVVKAEIDRQFDLYGEQTPGAEDLLVGLGRNRRVRFRATVVMPGPILRANTCFSGDTATWEFEGEDLYLQGFDLRARAAAPSAP